MLRTCKILLLFMYAGTLHAQTLHKSVIYFGFNKSDITYAAIDTLLAAIRLHNARFDSVVIHAYCDSVGSLGYNDTLAQKRVLSVEAFLQRHNVGAEVVKPYVAYGKRKPVNDNSTDELRALNRRAEVFFYTKRIATPAKQVSSNNPIKRLLENVQVGESVAIPDVNFEPDRHELLPTAVVVLDSVVSFLQTTQTEIEIVGFVCCIPEGTDAFDEQTFKEELSINRAKAVYAYLVYRGIERTRLRYQGKGSQPKVPETSDEARAINRRVEFKILKK